MTRNTKGITKMPMTKVAISLPDEIVAQVDDAAHDRGESRSAFVAKVLREALRSRRGESITQRLNALFADEAVAAEQRRLTREMQSAGTDWDNESW